MTDKFGLSTIKKDLSKKSKTFLGDIEKELVQEEHDALREFIKGGYRLVVEKEKEMEQLKKEVDYLRTAIDEASKGNWEKFQKVKIPARFFNEDTLRKHGKSLVEGSSEIRFVDLYSPEENEE